MAEPIYVWDKTKNRKNQTKHGVSFEEAQNLVEEDETIRIISARTLTRADKKSLGWL